MGVHKLTHVGVPFVVCVAVSVPTCVSSLPLHGIVDSYTQRLQTFGFMSFLRCESSPHIWPGTEVRVAEQFCSTIKAFRLRFFPLL